MMLIILESNYVNLRVEGVEEEICGCSFFTADFFADIDFISYFPYFLALSLHHAKDICRYILFYG